MTHIRQRESAGFTLLELLISVAVFLILSGAIMGAMFFVQKNHRRHEIRVAMEQRMRAAVELMIQEIGQAGLPASGVDSDGTAMPLTTFATKVTNANNSVTVSSTSGIIKGEILTIDNGDLQETRQVTGISGNVLTFDSNFVNTHDPSLRSSGNVSVYAPGVFPGGVLYPKSTASTLYIFGDLDSAGKSLILAKYVCPAGAGGDFTRQRFDVASGTALDASPVPLVNNVTTCTFNYDCAGSTSTQQAQPCGSSTPITFQFPPPPAAALNTYSYTMVIGIAFTIVANSQTNDPFTNAPVTLSKTFLSIQPRNVIAAFHQESLVTQDKLELQPYDSTAGVFNPLP